MNTSRFRSVHSETQGTCLFMFHVSLCTEIAKTKQCITASRVSLFGHFIYKMLLCKIPVKTMSYVLFHFTPSHLNYQITKCSKIFHALTSETLNKMQTSFNSIISISNIIQYGVLSNRLTKAAITLQLLARSITFTVSDCRLVGCDTVQSAYPEMFVNSGLLLR